MCINATQDEGETLCVLMPRSFSHLVAIKLFVIPKNVK